MIISQCEGCNKIREMYVTPEWVGHSIRECKLFPGFEHRKWSMGRCPFKSMVDEELTEEQKRARRARSSFAGKRTDIMAIYGAVGYRFGPKPTTGNQTSGKTKAGLCVAGRMKRYMAKCSRAHRRNDLMYQYYAWCLWANKNNRFNDKDMMMENPRPMRIRYLAPKVGDYLSKVTGQVYGRRR